MSDKYLCSLQYYRVLIKLWELVVADTDPIPESASPGTPHAVLAHSKICFETLIRLYYLRHGFETAEVLLTHYLSALSTWSMHALNALTLSSATSSLVMVDDTRATLILAAKGLSDQSQSYYLSHKVYRVAEKRMSTEDTELIGKFIHIRKEDDEAKQLREGHLPMNGMKDEEIDRMSNLIRHYADCSTLHQKLCKKEKQ